MAMYLGGQAVKILERSKNLIPFPYLLGGAGSTVEKAGVVATVQDDGGIYLKGTATADEFFNLCQVHFAENNLILYGDNVIATDGNVCLSKSGDIANVNVAFDAGNNITFINTVNGKSYDSVVYVMLNKGRTPAPYGKKDGIIPFRIRSGVNMGRNPKNLIPFPYHYGSRTINGVTWTVNDDGTITANGTATADSGFWIVEQKYILEPNKQYIFSGSPINVSILYVYQMVSAFVDGAWKTSYYDYGRGGFVFTAMENAAYRIETVVPAGTTVNNLTFKPMLNEGTKALPYYYYD